MRKNRERRSALVWICALTLAPALAVAQPSSGDTAASAVSLQTQSSTLHTEDDLQPNTGEVSRWASPDGRLPPTYADRLACHPAPEGKTEIVPLPTPISGDKAAGGGVQLRPRALLSSRPRICVLVEDRLCRHTGTPRHPGSRLPGGLISGLQRYRDDLIAAGYDGDLWAVSGAAPESIRHFLRTKYEEPEGLAGCLLVGDIFPIWYEETYAHYYGETPTQVLFQYPMDLYFSALYAEWSDIRHWDGIALTTGSDAAMGEDVVYDTLATPDSPRISVGRLTPSAVAAVNEYDALCDYFDRNHAFRTGSTPRTFNAAALRGIGLDEFNFTATGRALERAFGPVEIVPSSAFPVPTVPKFCSMLFDPPSPYYDPPDVLYLAAHGAYNLHRIGPYGADYVYNDQILDPSRLDPPRAGDHVQPLLVHLDSCYAGMYVESVIPWDGTVVNNCMAGCYLFSPGSRCLACVAPAAQTDCTPPSFWDAFRYGNDIGTSFRRNRVSMDRSSTSWILQGDPALRFPPSGSPVLAPAAASECAVRPAVVRDSLPPGGLEIKIVFSRSMDTTRRPTVTYDPAGPTGSQPCTGGRWNSTALPDDTFTVRNELPIDGMTGDGNATIGVSGAQCDDGTVVDGTGIFDIRINPTAVVSPHSVLSRLAGGGLAITVLFSHAMDPATEPTITYDPAGPMGPAPCTGGSWRATRVSNDTYTVHNDNAIDETTGDGMAAVTVSGARRTDGIVMPEWRGTRFLIHVRPPGAIIHVDDDCGPAPDQDGSERSPYGTIEQGLEASIPGNTVFVHAGSYASRELLLSDGVDLIGESPARTAISTSAVYGTPDATLAGFSIVPGDDGDSEEGSFAGIYAYENFTVCGNLIRGFPYGIYVEESTGGLFYNNTIVECGEGIHVASGIGVRAANNIVAHCGEGCYVAEEVEATSARNCFWDNDTVSAGALVGDSIAADPLFVDPSRNDFRLRVVTDPLLLTPSGPVIDCRRSSPCLDAGTADTDVDGTPDIMDFAGRAPDIGAFEFRPAAARPDF